jgi:hypothetical protein
MLAIANAMIGPAERDPDTRRIKPARGTAIVIAMDDDGAHLRLGAPLEVLNPYLDTPINEGEPVNLVSVPCSPDTPACNLGLYFALKT